MIKFTEANKVVGCLAPLNITSAAAVGKPINLALYDAVTFLVYVGAINSTAAITVEKGTTSSLGTQIVYSYQSASAGTTAYSVLDGAALTTTVAATGLALGTSPVQYGLLAITVSKGDLGAGYNWVGVKVAGGGSANYVTILALVNGAYQRAAIPADPTS